MIAISDVFCPSRRPGTFSPQDYQLETDDWPPAKNPNVLYEYMKNKLLKVLFPKDNRKRQRNIHRCM